MAYSEITPGKIRFSVIVPLYNKEPYVEKALRSILEQTFSDFELIVVNDGSKDNSLAVAQRVLAGVENAKIINQENAGVSTARNNGVAASKGDYICFLDADDWWEPTFLEKLDKLIKDYPEAKLYSCAYYYVKTGRREKKVDIPTGYFNYCKEYSKNLQMPIWTGATCLSRVTFDEMGGFKPHLKLGEDFDLWIRIALLNKVAFFNVPLSNYNQDVDVNNRGIGHLTEPQVHMLWNLDYLQKEELTNPDYKQLIDNLRTYGLMPYYLSKDYHLAAKKELQKVDWSGQSHKYKILYEMPVPVLKFREKLLKQGSKIKRFIIRRLA